MKLKWREEIIAFWIWEKLKIGNPFQSSVSRLRELSQPVLIHRIYKTCLSSPLFERMPLAKTAGAIAGVSSINT